MRKRSRSSIWYAIKGPTCVAFTAMLAFVLPATAQGAFPATSNNLIVPVTSLGGVTLRSSPAQATAAWGSGGVCKIDPTTVGGGQVPYTDCVYTTARKLTGEADFTYIGGTVVGAGVSAFSAQSRRPDFSTPLTRFKTSKGIGIGSTLRQVLAAYPQTKRTVARNITGGNMLSYWDYSLPSEGTMVFEVFKEKHVSRVSAVGITLPEPEREALSGG